MGALALLALALVEIAMLVASIKTRSSSKKWLRTRTVVSVSEALVLALLLALPFSGMSFDFRWIALFVVLAARAVIALIVFFVRNKRANADVPHRTPRMVLNVIGSLVVIAVATVPALLFPAYTGLPTTGDYGVKESHAIMVDVSSADPFKQDGSHREIPVWFYYPDGAASQAHQFPLVVFSHGAFGYHESNYSLYAELASHGYVVAALEYPHHSLFATSTSGETILVDRDFITQVIATQNGEVSDEESYPHEQEWVQVRMSGLSFALDTIGSASRSGSLDDTAWFFDAAEQKALVQEALLLADVDKIGLIGHSLGGATSVGIGRTRSEVGAVIDLDGTMLTERSMSSDGTFTIVEDPYPVPLLSIDNEAHYLSGMEAREHGYPYVNNVVLDNASVSAHTYFKGSGHMNFTDLPLFAPALAANLGTGDVDAKECIEQTNALVLAWFDEHLKDKGHAVIAESY